MNQNSPYDQIIAAKLEQLPPLPAMADEIWLRISVRLDEDMPTDDEDFGADEPGDGPLTNSPVAPADSSWKGWSILLLMGGISLLLVFRTGRFGPLNEPAKDAPKNYRLLPPETVEPPRVDEQKELPMGPANAPAQPEVTQPVKAGPDSILKNRENPPGLADSLATLPAVDSVEASELNQPSREVPAKINQDSTAGRKRPSGVKGLNSDDYRIIPKQKPRDST